MTQQAKTIQLTSPCLHKTKHACKPSRNIQSQYSQCELFVALWLPRIKTNAQPLGVAGKRRQHRGPWSPQMCFKNRVLGAPAKLAAPTGLGQRQAKLNFFWRRVPLQTKGQSNKSVGGAQPPLHLTATLRDATYNIILAWHAPLPSEEYVAVEKRV